MSAVAVDDLVGQTLGGRYAVVSVLGEGTLGAVYQAKHTATGRSLALKVLRVGLRADTRTVEVTIDHAVRPDGWGAMTVVGRDGTVFPGWWRRGPV